jgi:hypothetical protein
MPMHSWTIDKCLDPLSHSAGKPRGRFMKRRYGEVFDMRAGNSFWAM